MLNQRFYALAAICCLITLSPVTPAVADEDAVDYIEEGGERCVNTRRISGTYVADDQTIIFYMRGGNIYRNTLSRKCPELVREKKYTYRTTVSRLCDVDVITVIYTMGSDIREGPSCGLGKFYPISNEEAQALIGGRSAVIDAGPLPPASPEEPEIETPVEKTEE